MRRILMSYIRICLSNRLTRLTRLETFKFLKRCKKTALTANESFTQIQCFRLSILHYSLSIEYRLFDFRKFLFDNY